MGHTLSPMISWLIWPLMTTKIFGLKSPPSKFAQFQGGGPAALASTLLRPNPRSCTSEAAGKVFMQIHHACLHSLAAVDDHGVPDHEGRGVRTQPKHRRRDLFGPSHP